MHQTCKGQQWYFGMKLHIAVNSKTGLAHSGVVTAAHVNDKNPMPSLFDDAEKKAYSDSTYASQHALTRSKAPQAEVCTNERVPNGSATEDLDRILNRLKSRVRSKVEHVFAVAKRTAAVGLRQGAPSEAGEERHAGVRGDGSWQHRLGAAAPRGMSALARARGLRCSASMPMHAPRNPLENRQCFRIAKSGSRHRRNWRLVQPCLNTLASAACIGSDRDLAGRRVANRLSATISGWRTCQRRS